MAEQPLILCVDDNDGARYALVRTLQRAGFRTLESATGYGALAEARKNPDLVVLDVQLPDISGYEVCQRLKRDPATSFIPVLQISADFIDVEHRTRGLELGADAYLAHPIEPPELIATIRSLLRARRAEESARRTASELQSTFDAVGDAICLVDGEGKIVRTNQSMERLAGAAAAELIGRPVESLFPGNAYNPFHRMATSRRRVELELQRGEQWLRVTCDPVRDDGEPAGAVLVFSDFTERRRAQAVREELETKLREKVNELQGADQRKDEFLAMLAHELRNPLAAVTAGLRVLEAPALGPERTAQTRAVLSRQVNLLARLVDDLLDVSRITRGKVELRQEVVPLHTALETAIATARPLIEERRHTLSLELPTERLESRGDPARLEQIFSNLLNNAAKYTPPGGRISARLSHEGGMAVIRVRDSGIGIVPEMIGRVFDLFTQVDQSPARTAGGLGVGLTLVRQLVELHGGAVRARSEGLGQGSEFEVRLPLIDHPAAEAPKTITTAAFRSSPGAAAGGDEESLRIVLVEDNPDISETLQALLELRGHDVKLAGDGLNGVELILATRPALGLVDIGLPGIDGYEVARRLRASPAGANLMLLALTGYGRPEDRDRAREAGFDAHLVKPVDPDELFALFRKLRAARGAAEIRSA